MLALKYLNKSQYEIWNYFVDQSPQGSIFSKTWYLDALQADYKILIVQQNNEIKAGIVLIRNEIGVYSNPMLSKYLGILYEPFAQISHNIISKQYELTRLLAEELKKYKSFDYFFHPNFTNWIQFYWHEFAQQTRYTYRIDLNDTNEEIERRFHFKLRNDIKNANKNKVLIETNIDFDQFYDIINKTFVKQGSNSPFVKPKLLHFMEYLKNINRFNSWGAIDSKKNLLAVCGLVFDNNSCYLILNGIDIGKHIRGANALMISESINYFKNKVKWYDFEGSMLPGVEQFYRKFGGKLTPYMRIWNDNLFNYFKTKAKKYYKKLRYGR